MLLNKASRMRCFENLYEKVSETLIKDNASYDCLYDLVLDKEESLTFFKLKKIDKINKFT